MSIRSTGMSLTYFCLLTFSALYAHTKSAENVRPCNRLPNNPTPEELAEADFYCKSVFSRYLTDPIGENGQRCPEAKNPGCTLVRTCAIGMRYRCTVEVRNSKFKSCVNGSQHSRVPLSACATTLSLWIRPIGLRNNSMRTPPEALETSYINVENEFDPWKQNWYKLTNNIAGYAIQGKRPRMEDRFVFTESVNNIGVSVIAVFDGHGGEFAAHYAQDHLLAKIGMRIATIQKYKASSEAQTHASVDPPPANLLPLIVTGSEPELNKDVEIDYKYVLENVISSMDEEICEAGRATQDRSGSTALVAVMEGSRLYVANVGDSRGVMCDHQGNPIPLSVDHKPNLTREKERIKRSGGRTSLRGTVWRVGHLALTRSLGDCFYKDDNIVTADPDIFTFDLSYYRPQFLVLASDGLFDVLSNLEVITFIKDRMNEPYFGAKSLAHYASLRGSKDNVTVLVVNLKHRTWVSHIRRTASGDHIPPGAGINSAKLESAHIPKSPSKGKKRCSHTTLWPFSCSNLNA